jgi:hypothetical protein
MESKLPSQIELKHAALDRRALANYSQIYDSLVDMYGRPVWAVRALNDARDARYERLSEFRFADENGRWHNHGTGAGGAGITDLIVWLAGGCPRAAAVEYLEKIVGELT